MNEIKKIENDVELNYSPHSLISQAIAQNLDVAILERLMDLQLKWEKEQARKRFFEALSKFQLELPEIKKNKKVSYPSQSGTIVNYNYTPLPSIVKQIKVPAEKNGFSYRFEFADVDSQIECRCIISHIAGHSETCTMKAGKDGSGKKNDIQSIGSTRTYLQRYTLIGAFGLTTAEDDVDGNLPKQPQKEKTKIPDPVEKKQDEKIDWTLLIKNCKTKKELKTIWNRLSEAEQKDFQKTFEDVKGFIEDSLKKETKK